MTTLLSKRKIKLRILYLIIILLSCCFLLLNNKSYAIDKYEGEYIDFDIKEISLQIEKKKIKEYAIRLSIYRLAYFDNIPGKLTKKGIKFSTIAPNNKKVKGIITTQDNIATVEFKSKSWIEDYSVNKFQYKKISNHTKIKPLVQ